MSSSQWNLQYHTWRNWRNTGDTKFYRVQEQEADEINRYVPLLRTLESRFRSDLAAHLYSVYLLHTVDTTCPPRRYTAWPLPHDKIPGGTEDCVGKLARVMDDAFARAVYRQIYAHRGTRSMQPRADIEPTLPPQLKLRLFDRLNKLLDTLVRQRYHRLNSIRDKTHPVDHLAIVAALPKSADRNRIRRLFSLALENKSGQVPSRRSIPALRRKPRTLLHNADMARDRLRDSYTLKRTLLRAKRRKLDRFDFDKEEHASVIVCSRGQKATKKANAEKYRRARRERDRLREERKRHVAESSVEPVESGEEVESVNLEDREASDDAEIESLTSEDEQVGDSSSAV